MFSLLYTVFGVAVALSPNYLAFVTLRTLSAGADIAAYLAAFTYGGCRKLGPLFSITACFTRYTVNFLYGGTYLLRHFWSSPTIFNKKFILLRHD